jgi:predicted MPP superfamily phosphohydrolase
MPVKTFWTRRNFIKSGLLLSLSALVLDAAWFEKFFIEMNYHQLKSSSSTPLGLKLIQISDLHLKSVNSQLKRMARRINTINPNLIMLTGDAVEAKEKLPVLEEFLSLLNPDTKKVAILGNWEYWGAVNLADLKLLYKKHNCELLINQAKQYHFNEKSILITGIDDLLGGQANIREAIKEFKPSDCHLILNHCPAYAETISSQLTASHACNAILSGHTHGGQINLFGYIPFLPSGSGRYVKGWYKTGNLDLYVSKGIGTSLLPVRFGARAEISVFEI